MRVFDVCVVGNVALKLNAHILTEIHIKQISKGKWFCPEYKGKKKDNAKRKCFETFLWFNLLKSNHTKCSTQFAGCC